MLSTIAPIVGTAQEQPSPFCQIIQTNNEEYNEWGFHAGSAVDYSVVRDWHVCPDCGEPLEEIE